MSKSPWSRRRLDPPELTDDLVDEILVRLPLEDPAFLGRASAVCKSWRRLLSDPAFHRRYRASHRWKPPLLGFLLLHFFDDNCHCNHFVRTTALPISLPALDPRHWQALDCHPPRPCPPLHFLGQRACRVAPHGRTTATFSAGAVLCSAAGCDHLDCHGSGGHFLVVAVGYYDDENEAWATFVYFDDDRELEVDLKPVAFIGDSLYFHLTKGIGFLKYNMGKHCLSLIDLPAVFVKGIVLMPLEGDVLGLSCVENYSLCLWSRDLGAAKWDKFRVIELHNLLPSLVELGSVLPIAFVEDADMVFLGTNDGVFAIELRSMSVNKVCKEGFLEAIVPYMSFYTPGVHLHQLNGAQLSRDGARHPQAS